MADHTCDRWTEDLRFHADAMREGYDLRRYVCLHGRERIEGASVEARGWHPREPVVARAMRAAEEAEERALVRAQHAAARQEMRRAVWGHKYCQRAACGAPIRLPDEGPVPLGFGARRYCSARCARIVRAERERARCVPSPVATGLVASVRRRLAAQAVMAGAFGHGRPDGAVGVAP